jgi:hypothetical protein
VAIVTPKENSYKKKTPILPTKKKPTTTTTIVHPRALCTGLCETTLESLPKLTVKQIKAKKTHQGPKDFFEYMRSQMEWTLQSKSKHFLSEKHFASTQLQVLG